MGRVELEASAEARCARTLVTQAQSRAADVYKACNTSGPGICASYSEAYAEAGIVCVPRHQIPRDSSFVVLEHADILEPDVPWRATRI